MKMLTTFVLLCAGMVLTNAAAVPEAEPHEEMTGEASVQEDGFIFPEWCPYGWERYNNRCFRYIEDAKHWVLAERHCRFLRGNLASVHSDDEGSFVKRLIPRAINGSVATWLGGSDAQLEGVWLWSDGSAFGFTNWCPEQPSNSSGLPNCITMNYEGEPCWHNLSCRDDHPFVCVRRARIFS